MSHTPGPWRAKRVDRTTWEVVSGDFGSVVTVHDYPHNVQRLSPDAHLIAAAPDLLAALEAAYDSLSDMAEKAPELGIILGDDDFRAINQARLAMAKAKGEV